MTIMVDSNILPVYLLYYIMLCDILFIKNFLLNGMSKVE